MHRGCRRTSKEVDSSRYPVRFTREEEILTVVDFLRFKPCRPILGCPGRWILSGDELLDPGTLVGLPLDVRRFRRGSVPDEIWVCGLKDGGLISYRKPDGRFVHTVCDSQGFLRKLEKLEISRDYLSNGG